MCEGGKTCRQLNRPSINRQCRHICGISIGEFITHKWQIVSKRCKVEPSVC